MATTPVGNPYTESSDLLANFPGQSLALANRIDIVGVNPFADAAARDAAIPSPVQGQMCSLNDDNKGYRYDGSAWVLFSGPAAANFTDTATGTFTDAGIDYKYVTYNASGTLTVDTAGDAEVFVLAGGGGSNGTGGGAGGLLQIPVALTVQTYTITVGAGGASGSNGGDSTITGAGLNTALAIAVGGGGGVVAWAQGIAGGCGGGAANTIGGAALYSQGYRGGQAAAGTYSGGGGQGGQGLDGSGVGTGGPGIQSTFTGASVNRAAGGRGYDNGSATDPNGTYWTGVNNSGDGGEIPASAGFSGVVIVRVVV